MGRYQPPVVVGGFGAVDPLSGQPATANSVSAKRMIALMFMGEASHGARRVKTRAPSVERPTPRERSVATGIGRGRRAARAFRSGPVAGATLAARRAAGRVHRRAERRRRRPFGRRGRRRRRRRRLPFARLGANEPARIRVGVAADLAGRRARVARHRALRDPHCDAGSGK